MTPEHFDPTDEANVAAWSAYWDQRRAEHREWMAASDMADMMVEQWQHAGVDCGITRAPLVGFNGYVRVPDGHPWRVRFCKGYDDDDGLDAVAEVHGGITYDGDGAGWIGFDTLHMCDTWPLDEVVGHGHLADDMPEMIKRHAREAWTSTTPTWSLARLRNEVNQLAEQVAAAS